MTKPSIFSLLPTQFRGKKTSQPCADTHSNPKQIQTNKNVLSLNLQSQTKRKSHNQSEEKTQTRSFNTHVHLRNICNEKREPKLKRKGDPKNQKKKGKNKPPPLRKN
jgi:hypothetical protein